MGVALSIFDHMERVGDVEWVLAPHDGMLVAGRIYADAESIGQLRREAADPKGWNR